MVFKHSSFSFSLVADILITYPGTQKVPAPESIYLLDRQANTSMEGCIGNYILKIAFKRADFNMQWLDIRVHAGFTLCPCYKTFELNRIRYLNQVSPLQCVFVQNQVKIQVVKTQRKEERSSENSEKHVHDDEVPQTSSCLQLVMKMYFNSCNISELCKLILNSFILEKR